MQRLAGWMDRWDQWALMRCPLLWQLRLHWHLPGALLWCALMLGLWLQWMDNPARWLGSSQDMALLGFRSPEDSALEIGTAIAWLVSLGTLLWWLMRVRVHNRWREHAPTGPLDLWWEYLWGALFLSLLLAPAMTLSTVYDYKVQARWSGTDAEALQRAARQVLALEALAAPGNAAMLVEWTRAAESVQADEAQPEGQAPLQALRWLMRSDESALAAVLQRHGAPLQALGYQRTGADSAHEQARQLLSAYRAALQSPLAQDWRAYRARHGGTRKAGQPASEDAQAYDCLRAMRGHETRRHVGEDPGACFPAYLPIQPTAWLARLDTLDMAGSSMRSSSTSPLPPQPLVQWTHPRHGIALADLQRDHFQRATAAQGKLEGQRMHLWQALGLGLVIAPVLVLARLMSGLQLVAWGMGMLLTLPGFMVLGMLGMEASGTLWIAPAALLAVALVRLVALRRPWAGSLLLGLAMSLGLLWLLGTQASWFSELRPSYGGQEDDIPPWLYALARFAALPAGAALLVLALSPLWRRWRGLPQH